MSVTRASRWARRPDDRPGELLEAALAVFAEHGYRNTTLDDVAKAAGVTKGTIYHYFSTKEELLLRAVEHYQERAFARIDAVRHGTYDSAADRVRAFAHQAFGSGDPARQRMYALLQGIGAEAPAVRREWLRGGPVRGWRLLAKMIEEGKASGDFRADVDADVAARIFVSGVMLQLVWQQRADGIPGVKVSEKRLLDSSVELLLHGLRK
ncbi:MAG: TetR/AcrR family transcriptional regulator [Gemmatimonadaceae bacterium]